MVNQNLKDKQTRLFKNLDNKSEKMALKKVCLKQEVCQACEIINEPYYKQLLYKKNTFLRALKYEGLDHLSKFVNPLRESYYRLGYRRTSKLVVSERHGHKKRFIDIGLYKPGTHKVEDIRNCPVQLKIINDIVDFTKHKIRDYGISVYDEKKRVGLLRYLILRSSFDSKSVLLTCVVSEKNLQVLRPLACDITNKFSEVKGILLHIHKSQSNSLLSLDEDYETFLLSGKDHFYESLNSLSIKYTYKSFMQSNYFVSREIYNSILSFVREKSFDCVIDFYCGVGLLSLLLAKEVKRVIAVESVEESIKNAKINAENNDVRNCEFVCSRVENYLNEAALDLNNALFILNPPRKGCDERVLKKLISMNAQNIIYVSCNARSLSRDLKILVSETNLKVEKIELYDMFPGTKHFESLVFLKALESIDETTI